MGIFHSRRPRRVKHTVNIAYTSALELGSFRGNLFVVRAKLVDRLEGRLAILRGPAVRQEHHRSISIRTLTLRQLQCFI